MRTEMKKKRNGAARRLRMRRTYTSKEIARELGIHVRTPQAWKKLGMEPINPGDKPSLFLGATVRSFLSKRRESCRCKLNADEFYCPRCRCGRQSNSSDLHVIDTGRKIGQGNFSLIIKGTCLKCGCRLSRFCSTKTFRPDIWGMHLCRGERRLYGSASPCVNTDLMKEESA